MFVLVFAAAAVSFVPVAAATCCRDVFWVDAG